MSSKHRLLPLATGLLMLLAAAATAQEVASPPATATPPPAEDEPVATVEELIVVTASRTEQKLADAPATMTVFTEEDIQSIPADDYGDLLRNVPGMNVTQTSARDIQMTGRGSTNTLATTQLVLLDGRSIYLDFFGFVMWDFLPVNPAEIKQIEAVRGPGSAVWGANAMTGVVNLITKRPQEMVGTSLLLGGGELGTKLGSLTHAGGSESFGYKLSAGFYEQDAYDRPGGNIPGTVIPYSSFAFPNSGTEQRKGDLRLSWDIGGGDSIFDVAAGYAATDGIVHTGIGPFDVDTGSHLSYAKVDWNRQALHVGFFANFLDADSVNLLTVDGTGRPLGFAFTTDTFNLDISNTSLLAQRHILTYGGNYRTNEFELEIAPQGTKRDEWGVFLQDEILFGSNVRWVLGARYDEVDPLTDGVLTPRTSLIVASGGGKHTFRLSYNEAFRTPSAINSYLEVTILQPVTIPGVGTFYFPADADGNAGLVEEHMKAYEVGYLGTYAGGLILTAAAYRNETEGSIDFFTARNYGFGNLPPASVGLGPLQGCFNFPNPFVSTPAQCGPGLGGRVPSNYSYRNIGSTVDRGIELSLQQRRQVWHWFVNGSWQLEPQFEGLADTSEQNLPPSYRLNVGIGYDPGRWFLDVNANYQDEAFWGDVLFAHGTTDAFTMVNLSAGVRLLEERLTLQVVGANIFDEEVQQHVFGDIISRKVTGQVGWRF